MPYEEKLSSMVAGIQKCEEWRLAVGNSETKIPAFSREVCFLLLTHMDSNHK
jgi:hypothetical protein